MKMNALLKKYWPDAAAVVLFLLISLAYFITPISQNLVLGGHDNTGGLGLSREQTEYMAQTGERTRWTNSLFCGMPTYQIAPSYDSTETISLLTRIYSLGTVGVLAYAFLYMLGFYILMRAFNFKAWLSVLGAIVWAFSSYLFIIIAAGHIWKVMTLAFIPPTIAGLVLCYRGKLLWGGAVTALFTAFQIYSNHLQMTYYFLFVMLCIVIGYLVEAIRTKTLTRFWKSSLVALIGGLIGLMANFSNLYHTYQYSQESMRGKSELTPLPADKNKSTGNGLNRDYITQWSYGIGETWTLMVPNVKGGGSGSLLDNPKAQQNEQIGTLQECMAQTYQLLQQNASGMEQFTPGLNQYWGNQPGTVGPVYVGALVCFLFILALFYVKGPMKWALLAATLISFIFAWGKNIPGLTNFLIDHLPMYNKFRSVSSALVMAELTIPLLALLGLARICREPEVLRKDNKYIYISLALIGGVCLLFALAPGLFFGNCLNYNEQEMLTKLGGIFPPDFINRYEEAIGSVRHAILTADAWRSLAFILVGFAILWLYRIDKIKAPAMCIMLTVVCLIDLWGVDRRYLNNDNFTTAQQNMAIVEKTPADEQILADKAPDYRVLDLTHDTFNDNTAGYWHKNIGGYHAAKLRRFQDIVDRCLQPEIKHIFEIQGNFADPRCDSLLNVLNMLNMKYVIAPAQNGQNMALPNPHAYGAGWFVSQIKQVKGADAEMQGLQQNDLRHTAIVESRYASLLGTATDSTGTVTMTKSLPNEVHYDINSSKGGLVVFSEIFYPEWTATIDGKPAEIGCANYLLRALQMPAGKHTVVFSFKPKSITMSEAVSYTAIALLIIGFLAALALSLSQTRKRKA